MTMKKTTYGIMLIGLFFFFLLYKNLLSMVIFIASILLYLTDYFLFLWIRKRLSLSIESISQLKEIQIQLQNQSPLPLPIGTLKVRYYFVIGQNTLPKEHCDFFFELPVHGNAKEHFQFTLETKHYGLIRLELLNFEVYDYLHLFKHSIQLNQSSLLSIYPEQIPSTELSLENTLQESLEGDVYSKTKKGDDCSQIFDLRSYQPGDKLTRVHWKLSSKMDDLIIKEYSQPLSCSILLLVYPIAKTPETAYSTFLEQQDILYENLFSAVNYLLSNEMIFKIGYCRNSSGENTEIDQALFTETNVIKEWSDFYKQIPSISMDLLYTPKQLPPEMIDPKLLPYKEIVPIPFEQKGGGNHE